ncbi:MAG: PilZ domain-containing protein [Desulfobacteria bacterium]
MFKRQNSICPRPELKWSVSAQVGGGIMHGETRDISLQGAFIRCRNPLNLNEVFDMVVDVPEKSLNVRAEVVWSNIHGPDDKITPRGMGVRFVKISKEDRRIIAQKLDHYAVGQEACDYLDTLEFELKQL